MKNAILLLSLVLQGTLIIPKIITFFQECYRKNQLPIHINKKDEYNSAEDPIEIFKYGSNLKVIKLFTQDLGINYDQAMQYCLRHREVSSIYISSEYNKYLSLAIPQNQKLNNLNYIYLTIKREDTQTDYLFPLIKNAPNVQSIYYENGILSQPSMKLIPQLGQLKNIILDKIHITNEKSFATMLFETKIKEMAFKVSFLYLPN